MRFRRIGLPIVICLIAFFGVDWAKSLETGAKAQAGQSNQPVEHYGAVNTAAGDVRVHDTEPATRWVLQSQVKALTPRLEDVGELIQAGLDAGATRVSRDGVDDDRQSDGRSAFVTLAIVIYGDDVVELTKRGARLTRQVEAALKKKLRNQGSVEVDEFGVYPDP